VSLQLYGNVCVSLIILTPSSTILYFFLSPDLMALSFLRHSHQVFSLSRKSETSLHSPIKITLDTRFLSIPKSNAFVLIFRGKMSFLILFNNAPLIHQNSMVHTRLAYVNLLSFQEVTKRASGQAMKPKGYWISDNGRNLRLLLENFARQKNFEPLVADNWYNVQRSELLVLQPFSHSLYLTILVGG
jgi:hypothetical protein